MTSFRKRFASWRRSLLQRLELNAGEYELRIHNNLKNLYKTVRKGDVVLVEGRAEISRIIKLFSNSSWSHIAMYVGDELIKKRRPFREKYLDEFGDEAKHLIIEAFAGKGVIASPLRKYTDYNIRICRPFGIRHEDLRAVMEDVIGNLGKRYDQQNILDIALMRLPAIVNPFKKRSIQACLGRCDEFQVICSGMIARAFQRVGYPIVPGLGDRDEDQGFWKRNPYGAKLVMRHYSQIMPRDFDLSPNFQIIKFNIIAEGKFKYKSLPWEKENVQQESPEPENT